MTLQTLRMPPPVEQTKEYELLATGGEIDGMWWLW
jgi:hypothetical protein